MTDAKKTLIVAGGGTGGHVLAGIAVADAWKSRCGVESQVRFVGAQGGIEEKLVPRAGYALDLLHLGSLNRVSLARKLRTSVLLPFSLWRSAHILLSLRPDAVLGVGGYASGPLVLMAKLLSALGIIHARTAILEQNSIPGMTNRWLGQWVDKIFCAFSGTEGSFKRKAEVSGNPVRSSIKRFAPATRKPFVIFIFGGSQGARGVNSLVIDSLAYLSGPLARGELKFIHQTGEHDFERVKKAHEAAQSGARVEKFIYDMPEAYQQASLLICRSGSSTLAEIAAAGRAAILIPFPQASDNHQEANARTFSDAGAATLMKQSETTGEALARKVEELIASPQKIDAMEKAACSFYKPNAATDIAAELAL